MGSSGSGILARAILFALMLPLALSSTFPVFARVIAGPAVHVCHCEVRGGHSACACPICHPERTDLRLSMESIRGQCGDEDPIFGAALAIALPPTPSVAILRAPVSAPPALVPALGAPEIDLPPPTPPPRLPLV
jgi:hypothetical protein